MLKFKLKQTASTEQCKSIVFKWSYLTEQINKCFRKHNTVNVRNLNTFGFQTFDFWPNSGCLSESRTSENRKLLFRFRTFGFWTSNSGQKSCVILYTHFFFIYIKLPSFVSKIWMFFVWILDVLWPNLTTKLGQSNRSNLWVCPILDIWISDIQSISFH